MPKVRVIYPKTGETDVRTITTANNSSYKTTKADGSVVMGFFPEKGKIKITDTGFSALDELGNTRYTLDFVNVEEQNAQLATQTAQEPTQATETATQTADNAEKKAVQTDEEPTQTAPTAKETKSTVKVIDTDKLFDTLDNAKEGDTIKLSDYEKKEVTENGTDESGTTVENGKRHSEVQATEQTQGMDEAVHSVSSGRAGKVQSDSGRRGNLETRAIEVLVEEEKFKDLKTFVGNEININTQKELSEKYKNDTRLDDGYELSEVIAYDMLTDESNSLREMFSDNIAEYFNKNIDVTQDITGRKVATRILKATKNSKIKNKSGQLIPLYHATNKNFDTFEVGDIGFHFGSKAQAISRANDKNIENPTLVKAYLNIENPLYIDEDFFGWNASQIAQKLEKEGIITNEESTSFVKKDSKKGNAELQSLLKEKGYDGIVYRNDKEALNGNSYIAFDDSQILRTDNESNELTFSEKQAVMQYKSSESFLVNSVLRGEDTISAETDAIITNLKSALVKLPSYSGKVYRNIGFRFKENFDNFINEHSGRDTVIYKDFTSASKVPDGYTVDMEYTVHYEIESLNAKDIEKYGITSEREVLFDTDTEFKINSFEVKDNEIFIKCEERTQNEQIRRSESNKRASTSVGGKSERTQRDSENGGILQNVGGVSSGSGKNDGLSGGKSESNGKRNEKNNAENSNGLRNTNRNADSVERNVQLRSVDENENNEKGEKEESTAQKYGYGKDFNLNEKGDVVFSQKNIDYDDKSLRKGSFKTVAPSGDVYSEKGYIYGKFGVVQGEKANSYPVYHLPSGMIVNAADNLTEAQQLAIALDENTGNAEITYDTKNKGKVVVGKGLEEIYNAMKDVVKGGLYLDVNVEEKTENGDIRYKISESEAEKIFTATNKENENFAKQVEAWMQGEMKSDEQFRLGQTPEVLKALGAKDLPVVMSQDVMAKITGVKHNISVEDVKKLPNAIADPIMVFSSATVPNAYVILTELTDNNGKDIVTALHLNRKLDRLSVNRISSVYGKENIGNFVVKQINAGNLKYIDKNKSQQWSTSRGLRLPKLVQSITDNNSILQKEDIVNSYFEKNSKNYSKESAERNGRRENLLSGNGRRTNYESAGKQAERFQAYKQELSGKTTAERKEYAKELFEKGCTEEKIKGNNKINVVKKEYYNGDMLSIVEKGRVKGKEVQFFIGSGQRGFDYGRDFKIDGMIEGKTHIYLRYDGEYTPQALLQHEFVHGEWDTPEMREARDLILNDLTEKEKEELLSNGRYKDYLDLYEGNAESVFEEFVADVFAGMNDFTQDFADVVTSYYYNGEAVKGYDVSQYSKAVDKGKAKYSFAGDRAETADRSLLETAKKMWENKNSEEDILKQTGWFKGKDGKWRFEIDDSKGTFNFEGLKETQKLSEVWDNKELYRAYPFLKDISVSVVDFGSNNHKSGEYSGNTNSIRLSDQMTKQKFKETLAHEVQHAIQAYEGFDDGGNPFEMKDYLREKAQQYLASVNDKKFNDILQKGTIKDLYDYINNFIKSEFKADTVEEASQKAYLRLHGEKEARATEKRLNLSEEERKEKYPDYTKGAMVRNVFKRENINDGISGVAENRSESEFIGSLYSDFGRRNGKMERMGREFSSTGISETVFHDGRNGRISYSLTFDPNETEKSDNALTKWNKTMGQYIEEYGAIEKGEIPARDINVPKQTNGKKVVSKFARTMLEAGR